MKKRFRNCCILLLSIILVMSACPSVLMASAVTSSLFTCDFETVDVGTATSAVMTQAGWNGASKDVGTIENDNEHGNYLHWTSNAAAGFKLGENITSGIIKVSFSFKATTAAQNYVTLTNKPDAYDYNGAGTGLTDRSYLSTIGPLFTPSTTGDKQQPNNADFSSTDNIKPSLNEWHKVEYVIDMDNKKFTFSVDGRALNNTYAIKHSSNTSVGAFYFHIDTAPDFYIDDIVVEHDDGLVPRTLGFTCDFNTCEENEVVTNETMKRLGWNGAESGNLGKIVNHEGKGKCLLWDSACDAGFNLDSGITSGKIRIKFSFMPTIVSAGSWVVLSNKSDVYSPTQAAAGTALTDRSYLSTMGSVIRPSIDGNKPATTITDTRTATVKEWNEVEYVIDMDAKTFVCYVNGTAWQEAPYAIKHSSNTNVGSFMFFKNESNAAWYVDDFVVTYEKTGSNASDDFALSDLKIEKDGAEITGPVTAGDKINVAVKALNTKGTKKVTLVYASYNGNKLVDVKSFSVNIPSSAEVQEITSEEYTVTGSAITETRAFIWDNTTVLTPLATSVKYPK